MARSTIIAFRPEPFDPGQMPQIAFAAAGTPSLPPAPPDPNLGQKMPWPSLETSMQVPDMADARLWPTPGYGPDIEYQRGSYPGEYPCVI